MIEVEQTLFSKEEGGNCFAACVASIFEVPLDSVPNPAEVWAAEPEGTPGRDERAWQGIQTFLAELGVEYTETGVQHVGGWRPNGLWIATVGHDGGYSHSVVMEGDRLAWDPHPSRADGTLDLNRIQEVGWFVLRDPAELAVRAARLSPSIASAVRQYLRPAD